MFSEKFICAGYDYTTYIFQAPGVFSSPGVALLWIAVLFLNKNQYMKNIFYGDYIILISD